jgi:hypothetical protein
MTKKLRIGLLAAVVGIVATVAYTIGRTDGAAGASLPLG